MKEEYIYIPNQQDVILPTIDNYLINYWRDDFNINFLDDILYDIWEDITQQYYELIDSLDQ